MRENKISIQQPSRRFPAIVAFVLVFTGGHCASWGQMPTLTDVTAAAGINAKHSFGDFELSNIVEGTGSGATFFDYDGDGWIDLYLPVGCWLADVSDNRGRSLRGTLRNHLFHNNRDGTFSETTEQTGLGDTGFSFSASSADYDGDGDQDLYVLNYGANTLYRNNGDGTFTDVTQEAGLGDPRWSLSAPWFDYDSDGDLDVYVANYLQYDHGKFRSYYAAANYPGPLSYDGTQDALYRNNGDGTFTNVTEEAGLVHPNGRAMSASVADINNDGLPDLFVTNDAMENYYYQNSGHGTFREEGLALGLAFGESGQGVSSMGPSIGDVDQDGRQDIYIPDMAYGSLMINRGDYFEDQTVASRLAVACGQYTGWGGLLVDLDHDGYLDLFVSNGNAHHEFPEEDILMRNNADGTFVDVATESGPYFRQKYVGRGAAAADIDNDGDLDLLVVNLNDSPRLLRNDGGNRKSWLMVEAKLPGGHRDAVGARVTVQAGALVQIRDLVPVTGYLAQSDPRAHFGLGSARKADRVEVRWPDGRATALTDVPTGQILTVVQDEK